MAEGGGLTGQRLDELPQATKPGVVERAVEAVPQHRRFEPATALEDLRLPVDIRGRLEPPLVQLGYAVRDTTSRELKDRRKLKPHANERQYTVAERNDASVFLVHLHPRVAKKATGIYRDAVSTLGYEFESGQLVPMFSTKLPDIDPYITETLMKTVWGDIRSFFVPYQRVTVRLSEEPNVAEYVTTILHLDQASSAGPAATLGPDLNVRLRNAIVAAYPDPRSLEEMFQLSFGRNLHELVVEGTLTSMVTQLILRAGAEGWVDQLVKAVVQDQPANLAVRELAAALGLSDQK